MTLILPSTMDAPAIPASFLRGLRDTDPNLIVYWNRFRSRFVVDRVFRDESGEQRTNVLVVEDPDGGYMTPGDFTLAKIRSMDAWSQFGGNDQDALARFRKKHENEKQAWDTKQIEDARQNWHDGLREDRVQVNKIRHLIQQHDIARPNK